MNSIKNLTAEQKLKLLAKTEARERLAIFTLAVDENYTINWHHRVIAKTLESVLKDTLNNKPRRVILQLPPRSGKSELATIKFPAWVLGKHPELPIIVASYSGELARDFGLKTRDLMENPNYQAIFNTKLREDAKAKSRWLTEKGGGYTAVGVGGTITGRGFKIGIIDDPIKNREEAESQVYRDRVWNWFRSTFYTRQDGVGSIILILTRWHQDDLAGRLIKQQKDEEKANIKTENWEIISFQAIAIKDEKYRKKGEPLWKERFDLERLQRIKNTIGTYEFSALYQQEPIASEAQEFKDIYFQYRRLDEVKIKDTRRFVTIDTAVRKTEQSDYTGIAINFVDRENNWNVIAYRIRVTPQELIDLIFKLYDDYRFELLGIEKTAYSLAIKPFLDEEMRKRNRFFSVELLSHKNQEKEIRIRGLLPRYQTGSIYHIEGRCQDLEEELLTFPKGVHDDVADALAYQLQIAKKPEPAEISQPVEVNPDPYF